MCLGLIIYFKRLENLRFNQLARLEIRSKRRLRYCLFLINRSLSVKRGRF